MCACGWTPCTVVTYGEHYGCVIHDRGFCSRTFCPNASGLARRSISPTLPIRRPTIRGDSRDFGAEPFSNGASAAAPLFYF